MDLRERKRRWRAREFAAALFAVAIHSAILGLFLIATPRLLSTAREQRSISLDIVESSEVFRPVETRRARASSSDRAHPAPAAAEVLQAGAPSTPKAISEPPPVTPAGPPATDNAALGRALRASLIGCAHAQMANLSDAQRQHCLDSLAANHAGAPDLSAMAISPEKRAIFDAAWTADHSPQHMAGVACLARFGGRKLEWLHPTEGVKLGPLPCYVFTPKATFSADRPHAPGW